MINFFKYAKMYFFFARISKFSIHICNQSNIYFTDHVVHKIALTKNRLNDQICFSDISKHIHYDSR